MSAEQIGLWAGFVLTLMIFSYILGDNFLYRVAVYVFVGLAAGFISIVTVEGVLLPWIRTTVLDEESISNNVLGLIPFIVGVLLLFKASPRLGRLGNIAIAAVVGIGAAVALVGAISGTLLPLTEATGDGVSDKTLDSVLIVIGVICSLVYFQYLARPVPGGEPRRGLLTRLLGTIGQGFIAVTLGALYASAIVTSLTIFSERISFILTRINGS